MNEGMENLIQFGVVGSLGEALTAVAEERYEDARGFIVEARGSFDDLCMCNEVGVLKGER